MREEMRPSLQGAFYVLPRSASRISNGAIRPRNVTTMAKAEARGHVRSLSVDCLYTASQQGVEDCRGSHTICVPT